MKKIILIFWFLIMLLFFSANNLNAQNLTAREIMNNNDTQQRANDESSELEMQLINKRGKIRTRKVVQVKKNAADLNEKTLIRFLSPADVKGTGMLTIERSDRDDDQWLYLPALKKVRRISSSDKSDNFVGTDFTYQDLKSEELENYDYKILKKEKLGGLDCYVISAEPNNPKEKKESGYGKREIWIDKENFVNIQTKFYDKKGELFKILKAEDIRLIKGTKKRRAYKMEMENLKTKHKTVLLFNNFKINKGIPDKNFTKRYLKRGR